MRHLFIQLFIGIGPLTPASAAGAQECLPGITVPRIERTALNERGWGEADVAQVDLNGDGTPDMRAQWSDTCGGWGECMVAYYVVCADGTFGEVLAPEYRYLMREQHGRRGGWRTVVETQRGGTAENDDLHTVEWRYDADRHHHVHIQKSRKPVRRVRD